MEGQPHRRGRVVDLGQAVLGVLEIDDAAVGRRREVEAATAQRGTDAAGFERTSSVRAASLTATRASNRDACGRWDVHAYIYSDPFSAFPPVSDPDISEGLRKIQKRSCTFSSKASSFISSYA